MPEQLTKNRNNGPLVIGHRGAMGHAPENTRASFEIALKTGADAVECDVRLSRDRQVVIFHDSTLDRTTNGTGPVSRRSWAELKTLDAGRRHSPRFAGERLWRLMDLLAWAKPRPDRTGRPLQVIVEIKGDPHAPRTLAERTVAVIRRAGFVRRAIVISFDPVALRRVKRLCPDLKTGLLFARAQPDLARQMAGTGADAVFPHFSLVNERFMTQARRHGWPVGVWTVNDRRDMARLIRLGVNAVATNFPDRMRARGQ